VVLAEPGDRRSPCRRCWRCGQMRTAVPRSCGRGAFQITLPPAFDTPGQRRDGSRSQAQRHRSRPIIRDDPTHPLARRVDGSMDGYYRYRAGHIDGRPGRYCLPVLYTLIYGLFRQFQSLVNPRVSTTRYRIIQRTESNQQSTRTVRL